jgi:tetratricopeptide (TPR) repeat protein
MDWEAASGKAIFGAARETEYELPIKRAIDSILRHGADAPKIKAATRKAHQILATKGIDAARFTRFPDHAVLEALLQRAQELRHEDPTEMVLVTAAAVRTASQMKDCAPDEKADLIARAVLEYANALRVAGNLHLAEAQLELAEDWLMSGTGDVVLELRLKDIRASLYGSQQSYAAATSLLAEVIDNRLRLGDRTGAARALIKKGVYAAYAERFDEAFASLKEAVELIDIQSEPELVAVARHNTVEFLVDAGRCAEAALILQAHGEELRALRGRVNDARLRGVEGRIHGALGKLDLAESVLREARAGALEAGVKQLGALATLDLATVVLRQGRERYPEAVTLAVEALQVFTDLRVKPQVVEALCVLTDAIQQGLLTATLLQGVADFLRKAEHDRRARYQPRFE